MVLAGDRVISGYRRVSKSCPLYKPRTDIDQHEREVRKVPCVDGSELARAFFTYAALVGAAMCSACRCGSHDRWP
jgi:hypothetical protein